MRALCQSGRLDEVALGDGPDALPPLEQPAVPATMVAAATAINSRKPPTQRDSGRNWVAPQCPDCSQSGGDQRSPSDEKRCGGQQQPGSPLVSGGGRRGQTFGPGQHVGSGGRDGAMWCEGSQGQRQERVQQCLRAV